MSTNLAVVLAIQIICAHLLTVELYPLLQLTLIARKSRRRQKDIAAICAAQGTYTTCEHWTPFLAATTVLQAVVVGVVMALHPLPITMSFLELATWPMTALVTFGFLQCWWSAYIRDSYLGPWQSYV